MKSGRILCHPGDGKSCGACCGMYNHREWDEAATTARILKRTRAFVRDARIEEEASLKRFRQTWEDPPEVKLLTDLPSCPFLGFLEKNEEGEPRPGKVGCLVHPLQNDGVDGRDCGVYDRFTCEDYLCAAHDVLRGREVHAVLSAVKDSYLYGLVITNPRFVKVLLEEVAVRTGGEVSERHLQEPGVGESLSGAFELLRAWGHRSEDGIFGQVEVTGPLETSRRRMLAPGVEAGRGRMDALLLCLGTYCQDGVELAEARGELEEAVGAVATAVEACRARGRGYHQGTDL